MGLGAMMSAAQKRQDEDEILRVKAFGRALENEISQALDSIRLWPKAQLVRIMMPTSTEEHMRFAGAWSPTTERHTQTQQAVSFAGFEYSVQLEMSKALRRELCQNSSALEAF